MQEYQRRYIENIKEIRQLNDIFKDVKAGFSVWVKGQLSAEKTAKELRSENISLLEENLFPLLDRLYDATDEEIEDLESFSDELMDWKINLDCGTYLLIHESLLRLYRLRKDREKIIRELYKVGMGLFYQNRMLQGLEKRYIYHFLFEDEMAFTEAGSYLRHFETVKDDETRGYIIRSLANIAIATPDRKKKVAASARMLEIIHDSYYRDIAPNLPWDTFLRRTYQQMSANRAVLSKGDLSSEELSLILEACQVVFEPEVNSDNPNIRWLWPYYEMEYSCGFADTDRTLERMKKLIDDSPYDRHDGSGLYGNVQLAIYYGKLLSENPSLLNKKANVEFLDHAYRKMMDCLMAIPVEEYGDFLRYQTYVVFEGYFETEGVETYRDVTRRLMQKFSGRLYLESLRFSDLLKLFCENVYDNDPSFFDDIPFLKEIEDPEVKKKELLLYAEECGLYGNFGLSTIDTEQISSIREFYQREYEIYQLHCIAGHGDLLSRESTRRYADIALGHHSYYSGKGGYPEEYDRIASPYRQMTDAAALVSFLLEEYQGDPESFSEEVEKKYRDRFSPALLSCFDDPVFIKKVREILDRDKIVDYRRLYEQISS